MQINPLTLDSAGVAITVTGPESQRAINTTAFASRFLFATTLVEQLDIKATTIALGTLFGGVRGNVEIRGMATGGVKVHKASLSGHYDSTFMLVGDVDFGQGVGLQLDVEGGREGDATALHIKRIDLTEGGRAWNLAQPSRIRIAPREIVMRDFDLRTPDRQIAISGRLSSEDSSDLTVHVKRLELASLKAVGLAPRPGRVDASLRLHGAPLSPTLAGTLVLTSHDRGDAAGQINSELTWTAHRLQLKASMADGAGRTMTASGTLPLGLALSRPDTAGLQFVTRSDPHDTLVLALKSDSMEAAVFEPFLPSRTLNTLRGRLFIDARVAGTLERAAAEGIINVDDLSVLVPPVDVHYTGGRLRARLDGSRVLVDTLVVFTGKDQRASIRGTLTLEPFSAPPIDLLVDLKDFVLSNTGLIEGRGSGTMQITGSLGHPVITGSVVANHAELRTKVSDEMLIEDVTLEREDKLEIARHFGPKLLTAGGKGTLFQSVSLDLDVQLPQQAWFRRSAAPKIDVEVTGRVQVQMHPGEEMKIDGTVEPLAGRSTLDLFGRSFDVTEGEISLNGPLDQARMRATALYHPSLESGPGDDNVLITVVATGRFDSLGLAFSSEPSMPQDDIISYIVTGRPASSNPLASDSSSAVSGENIVLGQLDEALSKSVGRELGLDVFQIREDPDQGLVIMAGRYVTSRFYLSLQQPLEPDANADKAAGKTLGPGFELQYRLRPGLRFTARGGSLDSAILFRIRHAY